MPNLTGTELAEECQRIRPGIPIIFAPATLKASLKSGRGKRCWGLLMKPVAAEDLATTIQKVLDERPA
jgi:two-component SAPR family response regulator